MDAPRERGLLLRIHEVFETEHIEPESPQETDQLLWVQIRRGLLVSIGAGCALLGFTLMLTLVRPESLMKLSTIELASIVGFVIFPVATFFAVKYDRSVVQRCQLTTDDCETHDVSERRTHGAHERGVRALLHQRNTEMTEKRCEDQESGSTKHTITQTPAA